MALAVLTRALPVSSIFYFIIPPGASTPMYIYSLPLAVDTAQTLEGISAQILQNQKDLPAAIAANQAAGAAGGNEGASAISGAFDCLMMNGD